MDHCYFGSLWNAVLHVANPPGIFESAAHNHIRRYPVRIRLAKYMLIILVCCFILGFECGAGAAWIGYLGWHRPAYYNVMFAVYFVLICGLATGCLLRMEDALLESIVGDEQQDGHDTSESTTGRYEPLLIV